MNAQPVIDRIEGLVAEGKVVHIIGPMRHAEQLYHWALRKGLAWERAGRHWAARGDGAVRWSPATPRGLAGDRADLYVLVDMHLVPRRYRIEVREVTLVNALMRRGEVIDVEDLRL